LSRRNAHSLYLYPHDRQATFIAQKVGYMCNFINLVQNLGATSIKIWGTENSQFQSNFNFASALLRNRPRYHQSLYHVISAVLRGSCLLVIVLCNLVLGITWCYWKIINLLTYLTRRLAVAMMADHTGITAHSRRSMQKLWSIHVAMADGPM